MKIDQFDVNKRLRRLPPKSVAELLWAIQTPGTELYKQYINSLINKEEYHFFIHQQIKHFMHIQMQFDKKELDQEEYQALENYFIEREEKIRQMQAQIYRDELQREAKVLKEQVKSQSTEDLSKSLAAITQEIAMLSAEVNLLQNQLDDYSHALDTQLVELQQAKQHAYAQARDSLVHSLSDDQIQALDEIHAKDTTDQDLLTLKIASSYGADINPRTLQMRNLMRAALAITGGNLSSVSRRRDAIDTMINVHFDADVDQLTQNVCDGFQNVKDTQENLNRAEQKTKLLMSQQKVIKNSENYNPEMTPSQKIGK